MINKLSIKKKLLIYSFFIQLIILLIFSFSLYKALNISTVDKINSTLKVILLDVVDDILEHKRDLKKGVYNEEKAYKFEPLYIRLLRSKDLKVITQENFPKNIKTTKNKIESLQKDIINFEKQNDYIISRIKIDINNDTYIVEVATNNQMLNQTLENLLYILIFIVPIILILSTIGGYFLIYKSFLPIENLLSNLKNIHGSNLSKRLDSLNNNDEIDQLTQEINSLISRLEISFNKINQFSSDASHELKTPLTIIRGELEIALRKNRTQDEYKEVLNSCLEEVLIIQKTIDDLLFLAKPNEQIKSSQNDSLDIDIILYDAVKELQNYAENRYITIVSNISKCENIKYPSLLKIAIKNILKNGIDFSHENSEVYISNQIKNGQLIISVKDNGIGIDTKDQNKIFESFYRTDSSRAKNSGGIGLGLAITLKIIKLLNGQIKLNSIKNKGTTITIFFQI